MIEFPAVLMSVENKKVIEEFHTYVTPTENPRLSEFCRRLTGISQAQVEDGMPLGTTLMMFSKWLKEMETKYNFSVNKRERDRDMATFITWYGQKYILFKLVLTRQGVVNDPLGQPSHDRQ